jgi:hypothetical protein
MPPRTSVPFNLEHGYIATQNAFVPTCIYSGQDVWYRGNNHVESAKSFGTNGNSGGVAVLTNVAATHGGVSTNGNVVQAFAASVYFAAGSGTVYVGGSSLGAISGSSINIYVGSMSTAGLTSPGAPTIADLGSAGHNNGSYSIALTAIRSTTGGESTIGAPSNVVSVKNHGIKITALGALDAKADKIGIYVTRRGFGSIGPYFHLYDVTTPSLPYTIQVPGDGTAGWIDAQLGDLAPLNYSVPPACTFVGVINSVIVAVGAYGGAGLSPSYPNKPEAYPATFTVFIPGGGTVTACKSSGIEGAFLVGTSSSMNLVTATASTISPLQIRQIWPTSGVASGNQYCTYKDTIYAYLGVRGAVRSSLYADLNETSGHFAVNVQKAFADNGFTVSNTVVGYDPVNAAIWYMSGTKGFPFMLDTEEWSPLQTLPATVTSCATVGGVMLMQGAGGALYTPETGSGSTWNFVPGFVDFDGMFATGVRLGGQVSGSVRLDILDRPNDLTHVATGGSNIALTSTQTALTHLNAPQLRAMSVKCSGSDAGGVQVRRIYSQVVKHEVTS